MSEFKIPYGLSQNQAFIKSSEALKVQQYNCPSCQSPLILRKSRTSSLHFFHPSSEYCSYNTVIHKTAQILIIQVITSWKQEQKSQPKLKRLCKKPYCEGYIFQKLPEKVTNALMEYQLPNGTFVDIALMEKDKISALINFSLEEEINTNKLFDVNLPWFIVDPRKIIENPLEWICLKEKLNPFHCALCAERKQKSREKRSRRLEYMFKKSKQLAQKFNIKLPPSPPYYFNTAYCYSCGKEIIVYTWKGHDSWEHCIPPEPKPETIQFRHSKTINEKYWVNCCQFCNAIQGDFFLYHEPDGAFYGFSIP